MRTLRPSRGPRRTWRQPAPSGSHLEAVFRLKTRSPRSQGAKRPPKRSYNEPMGFGFFTWFFSLKKESLRDTESNMWVNGLNVCNHSLMFSLWDCKDLVQTEAASLVRHLKKCKHQLTYLSVKFYNYCFRIAVVCRGRLRPFSRQRASFLKFVWSSAKNPQGKNFGKY